MLVALCSVYAIICETNVYNVIVQCYEMCCLICQTDENEKMSAKRKIGWAFDMRGMIKQN